jgi:Cu(I)/Ag(I) efflux system membrane fusion protein
VISFAAIGCNNQQRNSTKKEAEQPEEIYTCSMHPQVQEHHPGNCPICGMRLIKKNAKPVAANNLELESLLRPANEFVNSSLPAISPQLKNIDLPVKSYGIIEYDTRGAGTVSSRVSGRIEKMYIRYRFEPVAKGQKIMDIYSPELLTAQENLLFLLRRDASNLPFIQAAKEKLLLLGMSENELEQIIRTGKPMVSVGIYSSYGGHVHDAGMIHSDGSTSEIKTNTAVTRELSLKEGMYVQKGQTLLMIMNHHEVWAALQIFPSDQSLVKVGNQVSIIPETDTTTVINGHIDFIEPFLRENSKTITARAYFENMSMLPIVSQLQAYIHIKDKPELLLHHKSVIYILIYIIVVL